LHLSPRGRKTHPQKVRQKKMHRQRRITAITAITTTITITTITITIIIIIIITDKSGMALTAARRRQLMPIES
jgi:hypothetical protein